MPTVPRTRILVAVAVGGCVGTVARYELAQADPVGSGHIPWATFTANMIGSLVLGIAVVVLVDSRRSTLILRPLVGVGFCGGLTTFSTWMVESVLLTRDGEAATAALYLGVSLVVGLGAVLVGMTVARWVVHAAAPTFDAEHDE